MSGESSAPPEGIAEAASEGQLIAFLQDENNSGKPIVTRLRAHGRVIARVTDGIYRLPGSALRELIANAWDADATTVSIDTDAPRFSRITVRDDGEGMGYDTLAHVINSIGGSAKRRQEGLKLGISAPDNVEQTPGGRPFIGKIGIGLFSVSQLTRRFSIVTKRRGESYRLIANVVLRQHSEDPSDEDVPDDDDFFTGRVEIVREPAADPAAHGTDIILDSIKPAARDTLRSADRWRALDEVETARRAGNTESGSAAKLEAPIFHTGWISAINEEGTVTKFSARPKLPWEDTDEPNVRMAKLVEGVAAQFSLFDRPDLANTLDYYLAMVWQLGLSVPVPYVEKHPFDLTGRDRIRLFWIANEQRQQAVEVPIEDDENARDAILKWSKGRHRLKDGIGAGGAPMRVLVDRIELKRPISFKFISTGQRGLDRSMLMVGSYAPNLEKVPEALRGGKLAFEAYLFWNGRIIPKENNGSLVRIRGASGANFDETFFKYQVSEQTRLKQITAELFVSEGLDAALNIDRESFNFSHPHVRLTASWFHRALRQLTNKHKEISSRNLAGRKGEAAIGERSRLEEFTDNLWRLRQGEEPAPEVRIADDRARAHATRIDGGIAIPRNTIRQLSSLAPDEAIMRQAKAEALLKVLAAFGVLESRSVADQEQLVAAIFSVFYQD